MAIGNIWDEIWDEAIWDNNIWLTSVSLLLLSADVSSDGNSLSMTFTQSVDIGLGGNGGFTVSMSGGAATLAYSSGDGTNTLVYTFSRTIADTETGTLSYTQPGDGVEASSDGTDLSSLSGFTIDNGLKFEAVVLNPPLRLIRNIAMDL